MKIRNESPAARLRDRLSCVGYLDRDEALAFEDFMQSISVTSEELSTLLARPGLSVPEVKRLFERKH